jgi:hypothetical protein
MIDVKENEVHKRYEYFLKCSILTNKVRTFPIESFAHDSGRTLVTYVQNTVIRRDLQTPTVKEEIRHYSSQYSARLSAHPNGLVVNLMELPDNKTPAK